MQLLLCTRVLLQLPHLLLCRTKTPADLKEGTTWSTALMVLRVCWHTWASSSTSPLTLSPRIRYLNTVSYCLNSFKVETIHIHRFKMINVAFFFYRLCRRLWTFSQISQRVLVHVMQTLPSCSSQQMQRKPTSPFSSPW